MSALEARGPKEMKSLLSMHAFGHCPPSAGTLG
jgi:hypothetical protein